jgi:hypothetical protein
MAQQDIAALIFLKRTRPSTDDAAGFFLTQMQFLPNTLNLFRFRQTNRAPAWNLKPARLLHIIEELLSINLRRFRRWNKYGRS